MLKCVLYPNFFISLGQGLDAQYRKVGGHYEKRTLYGIIDDEEDEEWAECSMANYALALLKAHEQAEG